MAITNISRAVVMYLHVWLSTLVNNEYPELQAVLVGDFFAVSNITLLLLFVIVYPLTSFVET